MADATDSGSSRDSSSSENDQGWYAQQWNVLCDELDASDPTEVLARVQTMKREMKRIQETEQGGGDEGLVTISEVEEVFREMNQKMEKLRERNAALVERLEGEGDDVDSPFRDLHRKAEQLLDALDAATMDEARERIRKLNQRLENLYQEKEQLAKAGFSETEEAVSELEELREERDALRRERDRLQADRNRLEQQLESVEEPDPASAAEQEEPLQEAAAIMRDEIGVSNPAQAEAFIQIVEQLHERIQERAAAYEVEVEGGGDDVVELLRSMTMHLDELPEPEVLPSAVGEALGVHTVSEARTLTDTIRRVGNRFMEHYEEPVEFEEADPDADDALTLLRSLEDQLQALPPPSETDDEGLPPEIGDVLGVHTVEDARELESLIADLSGQVEQFKKEHEQLTEAGLTADEALSMIENMEGQLLDLYHGTGKNQNGASPEQVGASNPAEETEVVEEKATLGTLDDALRYRVLNHLEADPDAVDDLTQVVRALVDQVDRLSAEQEVLAQAGLDASEAVAMIESLEGQLDDLYRSQEGRQAADDHTDADDTESDDTDADDTESSDRTTDSAAEDEDAAERLAAIEDVLGISTREEAEELSQIAFEMEEQLTVLYQEKEKLEELGLDSIDDAVDLIESMEEQLVELYEDKEALLATRTEATEEQSTFQQLEALYAEREKMQQSLGVSEADEVIELVESLNSQLDDLYKTRDAEVDPEERHDALLWEPDPTDSTPAESTSSTEAPDEEASEGEEADLTMNSMEHQLEALYREKETLLNRGFSSAQEAVSQLQTQQKQIDALQRENHTYEQRFERLQSELGTAQVARIVEAVHSLESEAEASLEDVLDVPAEPADAPEYGVDIEATSPFVAEETLEQLGDVPPAELDDLDVGIVRLSDDGTVEYLNDAAFQLPGLPSDEDAAAVVGKNFFLELAPSTKNNLFYGRFQKGQRRGEMDARFPYTFTSPDAGPQPFAVHLYRKPEGKATWLLYRPT